MLYRAGTGDNDKVYSAISVSTRLDMEICGQERLIDTLIVVLKYTLQGQGGPLAERA